MESNNIELITRMVIQAINQNENVDMIYTDEDKISMDGKIYFQPHFKSDFNIDSWFPSGFPQDTFT